MTIQLLKRMQINNLSIINKMVLSLLKLLAPYSIITVFAPCARNLAGNLKIISKVLNFFDEDDLLGTIEKAPQKVYLCRSKSLFVCCGRNYTDVDQE